MSGSDCSYIYFWEKETETIVKWMKGDENGVVNCLEPHPDFPFLASSGLDHDVKIWVPSDENVSNWWFECENKLYLTDLSHPYSHQI
jgi:DDB1- and CUL4-associated factor 8